MPNSGPSKYRLIVVWVSEDISLFMAMKLFKPIPNILVSRLDNNSLNVSFIKQELIPKIEKHRNKTETSSR